MTQCAVLTVIIQMMSVFETVPLGKELIPQAPNIFLSSPPQGRIDFGGLQGTFYPAVSLNRNVAVTLHTALEPPAGAEC